MMAQLPNLIDNWADMRLHLLLQNSSIVKPVTYLCLQFGIVSI